MDIVYLDSETSGFKPGQICQLSYIKESDKKVVSCKNFYFSINWIDQDASKVTGLTVEILEGLSGGKKFKDSADEILNDLNNCTLVAHNLPFDENFLSAELWRCEKSLNVGGRLDTMRYFAPILKIPAKYKKYGPYKNPKLEELLYHYRVDIKEVERYNQELFGDISKGLNGLHNSSFDTTSMYVVVNIHREELEGKYGNWHKRFCVPPGVSMISI